MKAVRFELTSVRTEGHKLIQTTIPNKLNSQRRLRTTQTFMIPMLPIQIFDGTTQNKYNAYERNMKVWT